MKKYTKTYLLFCLFIAFGLSSTISHAQSHKTTVGLQFSPSASSTEFTNSSKFSMNGGLEVQYRFSDHFSIESGVHLFNRGFKERNLSTIDINGNFSELTFALDRKMIMIPATLMFNYNHFYIGIGPNINYVVSNQFVSVQGNSVQGKTNVDIDDRFAFGGQLILGYNFNLTERLSLDVETYYNTTFEDFNFYNYGIGIGIKQGL